MKATMKKQYEVWEVEFGGVSFPGMIVNGQLDGVISLENNKGQKMLVMDTRHEVMRSMAQVFDSDNKDQLVLLAANKAFMEQVEAFG